MMRIFFSFLLFTVMVAANEENHIIGMDFDRVSLPFIICASMIIAAFCKILFYQVRQYVSEIPESCVLICIGLLLGGLAYVVKPENNLVAYLFDPDRFFIYILPPIVMEAGYFMPKEPFFANLGTILIHATFGTILNSFSIGGSLFLVHSIGLMPGMDEWGGLPFFDACLFGSIISAVDPVAVISVFEEIHVNITLYICVFGESLLNDGVAVVLYKTFSKFVALGMEGVGWRECGFAFISFFITALGGLFIGIIYGFAGAYTTKFTKDNPITEPTLVILFCYMSYLSAEVFHMSGIIAIVFAGFTLSSYAQYNMSLHSQTTIHYGLKMIANINETLIFVLLGISAVSDFWRYWNTAFVLWTLLFVTLYRPLYVLLLQRIINHFRTEKICLVDQFVMCYGGLRGAIAFSLVSLTKQELVASIKTMNCATIVVIYFTCFIQGSTIRPIVQYLKVQIEPFHSTNMIEEINHRLIEHLMAGIHDIIGHSGHYQPWQQKLLTFHDKHISKHFIREKLAVQDQELYNTFQHINIVEAEALNESLRSGSNLRNVSVTSLITSQLKIDDQQHHETKPRRNVVPPFLHPAYEWDIEDDDDFQRILTENLYQPRKSMVEKIRWQEIDLVDHDSFRQENEIKIRQQIRRNSTRIGRNSLMVRASVDKDAEKEKEEEEIIEAESPDGNEGDSHD